MALNIGDFELPERNYSVPNPNIANPFEAPRKIDLRPQDERDVKAIKEVLSNSGLITQKLFDLFKEKYSEKQKLLRSLYYQFHFCFH